MKCPHKVTNQKVCAECPINSSCPDSKAHEKPELNGYVEIGEFVINSGALKRAVKILEKHLGPGNHQIQVFVARLEGKTEMTIATPDRKVRKTITTNTPQVIGLVVPDGILGNQLTLLGCREDDYPI